jgi:hypothetical protein
VGPIGQLVSVVVARQIEPIEQSAALFEGAQQRCLALTLLQALSQLAG